jgi:ATP-binding cassette subfamily C protein CydC
LIVEQERLGRIQGGALAGLALFSGSAVAAVLLTGTFQVSTNQIPAPNLVMLLLFSAAIFEAAGPLSAAFLHLPAAQESAARIFELADAAIPVPEPSSPGTLPASYKINFCNVSAGYSPKFPVLHKLSFSVPEGGCVVVNGPSGVGKSLLVEILLRFRNYEGSITVGGVEIRDLAKDSLRTLLSAVTQHPYLFNGTIRENVLVGIDVADDSALDHVLHDSCLDAWVAGLPLGLDTPVGMNGSSVSGGEGRRIALARALLKNAPILILDEPTEGLDVATERELIMRLSKRFSASATTIIVISHRPACRALGDSIIQLYRPSI